MNREQIITGLRAFAAQRPGLDFHNYGDVKSYRAEMRQITRTLHDARELLRAVELSSITAEQLLEAFPRAYSGRLRATVTEKGIAFDYTAGQYYPTEYRNAVCAVAAYALWAYVRDHCMPAPCYVVSDGVTFNSKEEATAYAKQMHEEQNCILSIEERYNGRTAGDYIRRHFLTLYGRSIAKRWFS